MHTSINACVFINTLYTLHCHSVTVLRLLIRRDDGSLHRDGDDPVPHDLVEVSLEDHVQGFAVQHLNLEQSLSQSFVISSGYDLFI